jgi:hypothetical protein
MVAVLPARAAEPTAGRLTRGYALRSIDTVSSHQAESSQPASFSAGDRGSESGTTGGYQSP